MRTLILIFTLTLIGCAALNPGPGRPPKINGVPIPDEKRMVYVQNIRNNSYGPGLHVKLTQYLREEIDRRGRFIQTRDKAKAAYRIYGEIEHYQLTGDMVDFANQQISTEMFILAKVEVQRVGGGALIMQRNEIPERVIYSNQIGYRESVYQAQERLLRMLALRIAVECEEAWYYSLSGKTSEDKENKEIKRQ